MIDLKKEVENKPLKKHFILDSLYNVESFWNENEELKKRWDEEFTFEKYMQLCWDQYCSAVQRGYFPVDFKTDSGISVVKDSFTFLEWLGCVEKTLQKHQQAMKEALLRGEIPDGESYAELEYVRRKSLEFLHRFRQLSEEQQDKILGL